MSKICILTFDKNPIATELFIALYENHEVYINYTENTNQAIKQIWQRKRGLRWLWFNTLFSYAAWLYKVGHCPHPMWEELKQNFPNSFIEAAEHNSLSNQTTLKELNIDIGILIGTVLIKPEVFKIPKLGMINLHQGNIPHYRGAPPAFWEHHNNEREMYVTVHTVVEKLDAGSILEEEKFSISNHKHFVVSKFYANSLSVKMLYSAFRKVLDGFKGKNRLILGKANTVPSYGILILETLKLLKTRRKKD